jgi:hypothetical protein
VRDSELETYMVLHAVDCGEGRGMNHKSRAMHREHWCFERWVVDGSWQGVRKRWLGRRSRRLGKWNPGRQGGREPEEVGNLTEQSKSTEWQGRNHRLSLAGHWAWRQPVVQ